MFRLINAFGNVEWGRFIGVVGLPKGNRKLLEKEKTTQRVKLGYRIWRKQHDFIFFLSPWHSCEGHSMILELS